MLLHWKPRRGRALTWKTGAKAPPHSARVGDTEPADTACYWALRASHRFGARVVLGQRHFSSCQYIAMGGQGVKLYVTLGSKYSCIFHFLRIFLEMAAWKPVAIDFYSASKTQLWKVVYTGHCASPVIKLNVLDWDFDFQFWVGSFYPICPWLLYCDFDSHHTCNAGA